MKDTVKKSNQLIAGKVNMDSVNQQRLIYTSMAMVNSDVPDLAGLGDEEITLYYRENFNKLEFKFCFADFCELWGIKHRKEHKTIRGEIDKATSHMTDLKLSALTEKGARHINAVEEAGFDMDEGIVWVRFTASFMPYMINLHKRMMGYTTIPIRYMSNFRSRYSFKLLEMLLQEASKGNTSLEIKVSELREIFDCADKYPDYRDFRKRTIAVAVGDIESIDIDEVHLTVKEIRQKGRGQGKKPVESVLFSFSFPGYMKSKQQLIEKSKSIKDGGGRNSDKVEQEEKKHHDQKTAPSRRAQEMAEEVARLKAEGKIK